MRTVAGSHRCLAPYRFVDWRSVLSTAVAAGVLTTASPKVAGAVLLLIAIVVLTTTYRSRVGTAGLSPVICVATVFLVVGLLGPLVYPLVDASRSGASIQLQIREDLRQATTALYVISAAIVLIGGAVASTRDRLQPMSLGERNPFYLNDERSVRLFMVATVPLVATVVTSGADLLVRSTYQFIRPGGLGAAGRTLALPAVALAALLWTASSRRWVRVASAGLCVGYAAIQLSLATRQAAAVPLALALGHVIANYRNRKLKLLGAAVLTFLMLPIPLALRGLPTHGAIPYATYLLAGEVDYGGEGLRPAVRNIFVAYPITTEVAFVRGTLSTSDLITSLNPLPGRFTDWYRIAHRFGLNEATPYNTVGQLGNHGYAALIAYMFLVGAFFGQLEMRARRGGQQGVLLAATAVAGLYAVTALQYSLRSSTRLLYYLLALQIALIVARWLQQGRTATSKPLASRRTFAPHTASSCRPTAFGSGESHLVV